VIVVDASALVAAIVPGVAGDRIRERIVDSSTAHAPEIIDLETAQSLRRQEGLGELSASDAARGFLALRALRLTRYPHRLLLPRVWELRANLSAYDAAYVALAELLQAPLLTSDRGLARAPGIRADIQLVEG
jgi:predicted nucleic acid-binding protein